MKIVIQKFGGTSLDKPEKRQSIARLVKQQQQKSLHPVVVVSAMGRSGDPYATDTLSALASELDSRSRDLIASCGEVIAAVVVAASLNVEGMQARALTGAQAGIICNSDFGKGQVISVDTAKLLLLLDQGIIPVVAGYQGISEQGEIITLGRGGSDTTASCLGAALRAEAIEIYTDVDGVYTADPRQVDDARLIPGLSYQEIVELAYKGARVIHPRAVEIAAQNKIPIRILSYRGTRENTLISEIVHDRPITGITSRSRIAFVRIIPAGQADSARGVQIFEQLAEADISVDFINIRPAEISFIIDQADQQNVTNILQSNGYRYEIDEKLVKISLVGSGMTGLPGIMAKIVKILDQEKISILETTDSHTTISCLIKAAQEENALQALHRNLDLSRIDKETG